MSTSAIAQASSTIREKVLALLAQADHRSMVEIVRRIPEASGPLAWVREENLILWPGVTQEFSDAMKEMLRKGEVEIHYPAAPIIYLIDGCVPKLPIAKSVRAYAKPRWLPVLLCRPRVRQPCRETKRAGPQP